MELAKKTVASLGVFFFKYSPSVLKCILSHRSISRIWVVMELVCARVCVCVVYLFGAGKSQVPTGSVPGRVDGPEAARLGCGESADWAPSKGKRCCLRDFKTYESAPRRSVKRGDFLLNFCNIQKGGGGVIWIVLLS